MVPCASFTRIGGAELVTRSFRIIAVSLAVVAPFYCGCTDLTEFEGTISAGVHVVSPADLSVVYTIPGIMGGRSLCAPESSGMILVATTEGTLLEFDSTTFELVDQHAVGQPSSAGYFDMVYCPIENKNSIYIIGALGAIIEIDLPEFSIVDEFSVGPSPVDLLIGNGRPYIYIADAISERVYEVHVITNGWSRMCQMRSSPVCMAADQNLDTILVGTLDGVDLLSTDGAGVIFRRTFKDTPPISAVTTIPQDTVLCAVFNFQSGDMVAVIRGYWPSGGPFRLWYGEVPVEGDTHFICASADGVHAYVLSYLGESVSRLISYNVTTFTVEDELDLPGYPMDLEVAADGYIFALTTE